MVRDRFEFLPFLTVSSTEFSQILKQSSESLEFLTVQLLLINLISIKQRYSGGTYVTFWILSWSCVVDILELIFEFVIYLV